MELSIIIPTLNDANNIGYLLTNIQKYTDNQGIEVIVVDGGSTDLTIRKAKELNATVLVSPKSGNAFQCNYGATNAKGKVLYFINADTAIHPDFFTDIRSSIFNGYKAGCYRTHFNSQLPLLKLSSYFSRFNVLIFRSREQTLFITKELFDKLNGFDEKFDIAGYFDIVKRIKNAARFRIIPKEIIISVKKYEEKNLFRLKFANMAALSMYYLKISPAHISKVFKFLYDDK